MSPATATPKIPPKPAPVHRPAAEHGHVAHSHVAHRRVAQPPSAVDSTALPAYARLPEGRPLNATERQKFEARFRHDLSAVRLHLGASDRIQQLSPGAQAVTVGADIYLQQGVISGETEELLAHELTHVIQQEHATGTAACGTAALGCDREHDPREHEAQRNALAFRRSEPLTVSQSAPGQHPQAEEEQSHGWFYKIVTRVVPSLKPILDRGLFNWIGDRVSEIAASVMEAIRAPLDTIRGIESSLSTHVVKLIDWVKKCMAALAKGDCSVLHQGIEAIENAIDGLTAPVFDTLKSAFEKVHKFFTGLWERYGAPLWSKIKEYAGAAWAKVEQFFGWVKDKIQPIINKVLVGWKKVKSWLGIGDDPDSENGLLPWIERKLESLWEKVKAKLEPIKKPLMVVGGILLLLSPAGPILVVGAAIGGVIEAIRWIRRTFALPNGVVSARDVLQKVILPKMISAITGLAKMLADKAAFVLSKLLTVKQNLDEAAAAASDSVVSFLAAPIRFVGNLFGKFVDWANDKLKDFVTWVNSAATRLADFCLMILHVLEEIAGVLRDLMRITYLLMGKLWNKIPACIRDPFIDFLGQQILGRIPIFQAIAGTPEAWAQTKQEVAAIIRTIFVDFDLIGAMKKVFSLMLRVLKVPMELLVAVLNKMGDAWDTIKAKPVEFMKNLFRTMILAFKGFFKNILTHLGHGIVGWITASLEGTGVQLPSDWTDLGEIFRFVASVLGLSLQHVFELMEQRLSKETVDKIRKAVNFLSGAWEWVSLIIKGDFAGFWQKIKTQLTNLKDMIIQGVIDWIMDNIVGAIMMQLITTADPTGISETIMLIVDTYRTIKTAVQYMRRILEMVQRMLDSILNIASGVLQPAADLIEDAMDKGMPVVIGFLANLAGFGNVGDKIKDVIKKIRDKVDTAILWLIDKAKAAVTFVVETAKGAVGAVKEWWKDRFSTKVGTETHTIVARGVGPESDIYIESTPEKVADFVLQLEGNPEAHKDVLAEIKAELENIAKLKEGSIGKSAGEAIAKSMARIADLLKTVLPGGVELPETQIPVHETDKVADCTVGTHVKAEPLTMKPPSNPPWRGSEPGYGNAFFRSVNRRAYTYVQGHLLNHHLYGPGQDYNLVPIHRTLNTQMSMQCEEKVKDNVLNKNKVVSYDIQVNFDGWGKQYTHIDDENKLPKSITLNAFVMSKKPGAKGDKGEDWELGPNFYSNTLPNERGDDVEPTGARRLKQVNLNSRAEEDLKAFDAVYGIGPATAAKLLKKPAFNTLEEVTKDKDLKLPGDSLSRWEQPNHPKVVLTGETEWT